MKPTSGTDGGLSSGITHDDRSKSMNSSAFSCGVSVVVVQPLGNGDLPESNPIPADTCRSLITTRPHCCSGAASTGVLNEKYWTIGLPFSVSVPAIQLCAPGLVESTLCSAPWVTIWSGGADAPT